MAEAQSANYYKVLGVSRRATREDIRKAFRELASLCQPKVQQDETLIVGGKEFQKIEMFQLVTSAYHTLGDDKLRSEYDKALPKVSDWDEGPRVISGVREKSHKDPELKGQVKQRATMSTFGVLPDGKKGAQSGAWAAQDAESMADIMGIRRGVIGRMLRNVGLK